MYAYLKIRLFATFSINTHIATNHFITNCSNQKGIGDITSLHTGLFTVHSSLIGQIFQMMVLTAK